MNRIIKFTTLSLVGLAALVIAAALILPKVIDPNNYRSDISQAVYDSTGMHLVIDGPIGWSVFPWLGLSLEQVKVRGAEDSELMELDTAEVSVKLLPLLSKKVEMQAIKVIGLRLNLVKDKTGKGNWEVDKPVVAATSTTTSSSTSETASTPTQLDIDIASVTVDGLVFSYFDHTSGSHYLIDQASMTTGAIRNKEPVDFDLQARVKSSNPDLTLATQLSATLNFDLEKGTYQLNNMKLSATPTGKDSETLQLTGNFDIQQAPLNVNGNLDVTQFNPGKLLKQIKIDLPPMADPQSLSQLAFKSRFSTDGKSFSASKLSLTLDDFAIDGFFKVTDLEKQAIVFEFKGNDLNLDRYLPPGTESTETSSKPSSESKPATKEVALIPEDALRPLNIKGSMELNSLTVANLKFGKPTVKLSAKNGRDEITIDSDFYQGDINVKANLDVRKQGNPVVTKVVALKGINLKAMSEAVPALKAIEGTINANVDVKTSGLYQKQLTKNLNGNASLEIAEGQFTEANFDKMVCEGIASIRKKDLSKSDWGESTHFTNLGGSFTITNGVAHNKDLTAALSNLNLKGDGEINLVELSLDYHVGLNVRGNDSPDSDPACEVNEDYRDVTWPVRCHGELGKQQCGIDQQRLADTIAGLLKNEAQKRIQKEIEKQSGPLKDVLKGFFK